VRDIRVAAHVHSEWSDDASWTLPDIAAAFARRGYDAVLMCEHSRGFEASAWDEYRRACAIASTPSLLVVPGIEYNDGDDVVHIPVWGDLPYYGPTPAIPDLLAAASADRGVAVFAHPSRREAWRRYDPAWTKHLTAMEIWNRKYNGIAPDPRAVELAEREGLPGFVALDFHTSRQFFPLAMRLQVDDAALTPTMVYDALHAGRFQALAFSRYALRYLRGPRRLALASAEKGRKAAARTLRLIRR
jgi:hypothetical protein